MRKSLNIHVSIRKLSKSFRDIFEKPLIPLSENALQTHDVTKE
jgi:hypothetical protein